MSNDGLIIENMDLSHIHLACDISSSCCENQQTYFIKFLQPSKNISMNFNDRSYVSIGNTCT